MKIVATFEAQVSLDLAAIVNGCAAVPHDVDIPMGQSATPCGSARPRGCRGAGQRSPS